LDDGAALGERHNGMAAPIDASETEAAATAPTGPSRLTAMQALTALWALFAVALALYLLFGRATIENGILTGTPVRVASIWSQFTGLMRTWGFSNGLIVAVWLFGGAGLILSVAAVWFAFAARDDPDPSA
jgi:hypothetical protein